MPVYRLGDRFVFPPPEHAEDGLLAVGGDLRPERLLVAYASGIFPWYSQGQPILWHSPDPRMVLLASQLHVPRSLAKTLRRRPFELRLDTAFAETIGACAAARRPGQRGTWITREMRRAYVGLHRRGLAHSAEAWREGRLVGGVYGVSLGAAFFGESMFALEPDASKLAFVALVRQLERWGITLIDSQVHTQHLERFGAREIPRAEYLAALRAALEQPTRAGVWRFDASDDDARLA
jgi:leucyl/phenylalanyl-tRNA---protein transferase